MVAQEERDIYSGEMSKRSNSECHLLRVVLEHVFRIPSVPPSHLEGCSCIDIAYSIGVIYFELKRVTKLLSPNTWKLVNKRSEKLNNSDMELIYFGSWPSTKPELNKMDAIKLKQSIYGNMKSKHNYFMDHQELLLPISLVIATARDEYRTMNSVHSTQYQLASKFHYINDIRLKIIRPNE